MKTENELGRNASKVEKRSASSGEKMSGGRIVGNEEGFVLVLSLMILVVLTLLGISANRTSITEVQIAGNENVIKMDFYKAEAAAHEAAQRLENENDANKLKAARTPFVWLSASELDPTTNDEVLLGGKDEEWDNKSSDSKLANIDPQVDVDMAAVDYGVVKGEKASSLKMSESNVYFYRLIGRVTREERKKLIEIGYKKRY